jgi:hypothetical protein
MANLSKAVCHRESDKCRFGNPPQESNFQRLGISPPDEAPITIWSGFNIAGGGGFRRACPCRKPGRRNPARIDIQSAGHGPAIPASARPSSSKRFCAYSQPRARRPFARRPPLRNRRFPRRGTGSIRAATAGVQRQAPAMGLQGSALTRQRVMDAVGWPEIGRLCRPPQRRMARPMVPEPSAAS